MPPEALPFDVHHDPAGRTLTVRLAHAEIPSFTIPVIDALDSLFARWRTGEIDADTFIFASSDPKIFSMGGDLAKIAELARAKDEAALSRYAYASVRVVHGLWTGLDRDVLTIGLVDGKAFGSGFEAIAACQLAIAGPAASFAFPEARFGLFPGMGATSLLARRASPARAEALILRGEPLKASEALAIGAIDVVTEAGETAESCAQRLLSGPNASMFRERAALRRKARPYGLDEAIGVVDVWVEAVLALTPTRIGEIERIARMQWRRAGKKKAINRAYERQDGGRHPPGTA